MSNNGEPSIEQSDELIPLLDDDDALDQGPAQAWRILVVDDDESVHAATVYVLARVLIFGRRLEISHAYSAVQAKAMLTEDRGFAVILLDVVMESEDAGLEMVGFIRKDLGMDQVRIILRTGQPGYAPELGIFNSYDINDYRTKAELTQTRLITTITSALRSYHQICTIADNSRGLERIVNGAPDLMERHAMNSFAEAVLTQAETLLQQSLDGIVCAQAGVPGEGGAAGDARALFVAGTSGRFSCAIAQPLSALGDPLIVAGIEACVAARTHCFDERGAVIYLKAQEQEGAALFRTSQPLTALGQQLLQVFATNVTACFGNVKLVEQLSFVAYHDDLTGLPNRSGFIAQLDRTATLEEQTVIALFDLQHFADFNDGLGHDAGNAMLLAVAQRLNERLGDQCCLARIGADVFGIIGPEPSVNPETVFDLFAQPFVVGEHLLPVSIVAGFCRMLGRERSGLALLKRANIALNRAKRSLYADYEYFVPEMEDSTRWRLEIIHNLRDAFRADTLDIWYQPQIALTGGRVIGVEALLRWPGDDGRFIQPPDVFIPLAEYSGLIITLGEWVLDQACAAFAGLRKLPNAPAQLAVNVSMPQFRNSGFAAQVVRIMAAHGMVPGELELEVTESLAMDEPKLVVSALQALKSAGARIAIDDFGTGYSSLSHLRELPVDCLKIDRTFVSEITAGQGGMFAETIVKLGHNLGMTVLAEGVETPEQAGFLRGLGCDAAQGYLFAKPMSLADLSAWLIALPGDALCGSPVSGKH